MDPPYGTQREFRGKRGGFSDRWEWLVKRMDPGMASYLAWSALLLMECRRVMESTEIVLEDLGSRRVLL